MLSIVIPPFEDSHRSEPNQSGTILEQQVEKLDFYSPQLV